MKPCSCLNPLCSHLNPLGKRTRIRNQAACTGYARRSLTTCEENRPTRFEPHLRNPSQFPQSEYRRRSSRGAGRRGITVVLGRGDVCDGCAAGCATALQRSAQRSYIRLTKRPSRVSIWRTSPTFTYIGTFTSAPVSSVAGLVEPWTVSPLKPGSVSATVSSTNI